VRKIYLKKINEELADMRRKRSEKFTSFGKALSEIPETSWSFDECKAFIDKLSQGVVKHCGDSYLSGTIYSCSLLNESSESTTVGIEGPIYDSIVEAGTKADAQVNKLEGPDQFRALATKLRSVYTYAFDKAYLWNSLHINEFAVGDWLTYQAVRMVAEMYGGEPGE
jgi:hypothetical protein